MNQTPPPSLVRRLEELFLASVFCGFATPVVASLIVTLVLEVYDGSVKRPSEIPAAFLAILVSSFFPAAIFGCIYGILGGLYLQWRNTQIGTSRAVVEAGICGAILSLSFPGAWTGWQTGALLTSIAVPVAVSYAFFYRLVVCRSS